MRAAIRTFAWFLIVAALVPLAQADLHFDPSLLVYTSDAKGFTEDRLPALFDDVLSGSRPVVLFIHGRGDEPQKSVVKAGFFLNAAGGGRAVHKLEEYGTRVLLVSWDSKAKGRDRLVPLDHMPAAAHTLGSVLEAYAAARARHTGPTPPVTLLAHSMGTIVLQTYVEQEGWTFPAPLFTSVVLSSADANGDGHPAWLDRIGERETVFVTVNEKDRILRQSDEQPRHGTHPLGRNPGPAVAASAKYVHFRTRAHEVFAPSDRRPKLRNFFAAVVTGRQPLALLTRTGSPNQFELR